LATEIVDRLPGLFKPYEPLLPLLGFAVAQSTGHKTSKGKRREKHQSPSTYPTRQEWPSWALTLFVNRRGDRLKMLWWDRDGLALFYKRLESGTFEMLRPDGDAATVELDATELAMLLSGVAFDSVKRRKRYSRAG
jgi:hypothetical protein